MVRPSDLVADCAACAALCCVAPSFERGEDFAFDKPAGVRCPNLTGDDRCAIHAELAARGCGGCVVYDCHGAGQRTTRACAGQPDAVRDRAFLVIRGIHEQLWLLTEAAKRCPPSAADLHEALAAHVERLDGLAALVPPALFETDLQPHEAQTRQLLRRVGEALGGRAGRLPRCN
ncbi:hypothetical protein [Vulgatibacter sp.]|uniref:hypothetical protein n=1 Tax=Vulgatibacter sp. TaxID=1971226 RepID=UPI003564E105